MDTNLSASATCADIAGNTSADTHGGIKIDTVAPSVSFTSPADGAVYPSGLAAAASYSCSDAGSGIASCAGDAPDGHAIDTSTPGPHTFTVTVIDVAGNRTVVTHTYQVQRPSH